MNLEAVLSATLEPYAHAEGEANRVSLSGEMVELPVKAVTPIGLMFHELSTNAAKCGALSDADGAVEVRWKVHRREGGRELELSWLEKGGPIVQEACKGGFGSMMMEQAALQLGGRIERQWRAGGVSATPTFPLEDQE